MISAVHLHHISASSQQLRCHTKMAKLDSLLNRWRAGGQCSTMHTWRRSTGCRLSRVASAEAGSCLLLPTAPEATVTPASHHTDFAPSPQVQHKGLLSPKHVRQWHVQRTGSRLLDSNPNRDPNFCDKCPNLLALCQQLKVMCQGES